MSHLVDTPEERRKLLLMGLTFVLALMSYELVATWYADLATVEQVMLLLGVLVAIVLVQRRRRKR